METIDTSSLDITVTQQGKNLYVVSGKDAPVLHGKMSKVPSEAMNLEFSALKDGTFTISMLMDVDAQKSAQAAG